MRVALCNVPIRDHPTNVPPYGIIYIRQALIKVGCEVDVYNFDYKRPTDDEVKKIFADNKYDMVGISAVVSTAYEFVSKISKLVKKCHPSTYVVVGGNLAANSEVLLRFTEVDFCVIGDGEAAAQELAQYIEQNPVDSKSSVRFPNGHLLRAIKGLCFLENDGKYQFTGYRAKLAAADIEWPDYSILEDDGSIDHYFPSAEQWFRDNDLEIPESVRGKRQAWLPVARGCASRCTFCHRFEKGYRARPVDQVTEHAQMLQTKYDVGVVLMFDESYGADKKSALAIASNLWDLGLYWGAGSVRAKSLSDEVIREWYSKGCRSITCGLESGSQDMLDIMEKQATVADNVAALKAIHKHNLPTNIMLVLAMPGETDGTIDDTIKFLIETLPYTLNENRGSIEEVAAFYAQALPGTPLYETYREKGLIGGTVKDEEEYLRKITNVDALNIKHYVNGTGLPMAVVLIWRDRIFWSLYRHYFKNVLKVDVSLLTILREFQFRRNKHSNNKSFSKTSPLIGLFESVRTEDMKNTRWASARIPLPYLLILKPMTKWLGVGILVLRVLRKHDSRPTVIAKHIYNYLVWLAMGSPNKQKVGHGKSLRKTVNVLSAVDGSELAIALRKGR